MRAKITLEVPVPQGSFTFERSEEHTSELQSQLNLVCRLLLEKKIKIQHPNILFERHDVHPKHLYILVSLLVDILRSAMGVVLKPPRVMVIFRLRVLASFLDGW